MAEALMLEMDGDSDGSINEEELVSFFLLSVKNLKMKLDLRIVTIYFQTTISFPRSRLFFDRKLSQPFL